MHVDEVRFAGKADDVGIGAALFGAEEARRMIDKMYPYEQVK